MGYILPLTFLLAPTYAVRFNLFGFPANLLMAWTVLVWLIFLGWIIIKKQTLLFFAAAKKNNVIILSFIILFFISGVISLLAGGFDHQKLGQFIVLFLQPISIFFIGQYINDKFPQSKSLLLTACYLLLATAGFYAIIQYFTLLGLPPAWQGNGGEPKRALSFFAHPNFYALWSAPLLAFLIPDFGLKIKNPKRNWPVILGWLVGSAGLLLSLSRAGWLGLAAAVAVYFFAAADKKMRSAILTSVAVIFTVIAVTPNLRFRVLLPFYGEKSAVSRLSLWQTGIKAIKKDPVFGLGLAGFSRQWPALNTDPGLASATHNYPHNIFLDLWTETGILGLISFIGIVSIYIYRGLRSAVGNVNRQSLIVNNFPLSIALFLITLLFSGLVDNPYFKNDLAMVFWIILTLYV